MDHTQGDVSEDDDLQILDNNKEKDEFDISSSDDGGLFNKVGAASKMLTKKKPAKKLTKNSELFPSMKSAGSSASAPKTAAGPKKTAAATSKKHKKSETQSESDKPARKKAKKVVDSDTDSDFLAASPPPGPRAKRGECSNLLRPPELLTIFSLGGGSRATYFDDSSSDF